MGEMMDANLDRARERPVYTSRYADTRGAPQVTKLTGGSSDYYKLHISNPTSGGPAYVAECNDIIEALGMNYAEGNAFKAVWRRAALRNGGGKPGSTLLYEAEKVEFFGKRLVAQSQGETK